MPTIYISKRTEIHNLIEKILFYAKQKDLDYSSILDFVSFQTKTSRTKVKEILDLIINIKQFIVKDGIITISDEKIPEWLEEYLKKEKEIKKLDKEMNKIENLIKNDIPPYPKG